MISFIVPYATIEKKNNINLNETENLWNENNSDNILYSTLKTIRSINSLNCDKEILLIDNTHTFPNINLPNVKIIKGFQALSVEELKKNKEFLNHNHIEKSLDNLGCLTMWVSMAFHLGTQRAQGDYIVLQHNDTFYNNDYMNDMIDDLEENDLSYISVDNKKIWLSTYLLNKKFLDKHLKGKTSIQPDDGGYIKTRRLGVADAYFFLCRRNFFDTYNVDWYYGDTNHGATFYCLSNNLKYKHLGPFWDNPNWKTPDNKLHTYLYNDNPFLTHLKGGFSEHKMSSDFYKEEFKEYTEEINNAYK